MCVCVCPPKHQILVVGLAIWPKEEYCTVHNIYKSVALEAMSNSLFLPTNADESFMWWLSRVSDKPMFIVTSGDQLCHSEWGGTEWRQFHAWPLWFMYGEQKKSWDEYVSRQPDRHWLHELGLLGCCSGKVRRPFWRRMERLRQKTSRLAMDIIARRQPPPTFD